ncbi:MAG: hypothetical protein EBR10_02025 [Planctomycetes bacterium]|nr:hypothetical protein [Planctomycetota bacterium]
MCRRYRARVGTLLVTILFLVRPAPTAAQIDESLRTAASEIVEMQAGDGGGEWPYEGVYRVGGNIPVAYRVGGTAIVGEALLRLPELESDAIRQQAIRRATAFVCGAIDEPLLQVDTYKGGYDVRAWGACYGARFLLALQRAKAVPDGLLPEVRAATEWYLAALQKFEIPEVGGWNYARDAGAETPCAASAFMTPACLQTMFEARSLGYTVDATVVERALAALERCRTDDGNFAYAAQQQARRQTRMIPGAVGRMVSGELALFLAGRSDKARVQAAVEAFVRHWGDLEVRRAKGGTHLPPYGVAPYYFWFAHYHAAQAVEVLPEPRRSELRAQLNWLLWQTREDDGTWNDRVFRRSAAYGTAMAMMSALMPTSAPPSDWK